MLIKQLNNVSLNAVHLSINILICLQDKQSTEPVLNFVQMEHMPYLQTTHVSPNVQMAYTVQQLIIPAIPLAVSQTISMQIHTIINASHNAIILIITILMLMNLVGNAFKLVQKTKD